jgi:hypothetical protein
MEATICRAFRGAIALFLTIERRTTMGLVLLIIVILLLVGAFPRWPYARNWGYGPSGVLGLLLFVLLVLLVFDVVRWGI